MEKNRKKKEFRILNGEKKREESKRRFGGEKRYRTMEGKSFAMSRVARGQPWA